MDMNNLLGGILGMSGMNMGVNPFMQLLNQGAMNPNWAAGLTGLLIFFTNNFFFKYKIGIKHFNV